MTIELISRMTGKHIAEWNNTDIDIMPCDSDPLGYFLIQVPDETIYFKINPGDIMIFSYLNQERHCGLVTFKDYYDESHRVIKVKSFFASKEPC